MQQIISNPDHEILSANPKYQFVKNPITVFSHSYDGEYSFMVTICRRKDLSIEVTWSVSINKGEGVPMQRTKTTAMEGYYTAYQQSMALFKANGNTLAWIKFQAQYLLRFMDVLRFEFDIPHVDIVP